MSTAEMQRALARVLADAQLRERFFKDPQGVGRQLGFGAEEVRRLAELSPKGLGLFASSLYSQWLFHISKVMPLTAYALGDRFATELRAYAATHLPGGVRRIMQDALAFNLHLGKVLKRRKEERWVIDLLRYERARIKAAVPRRRVVACVFRHDISRLVRSLARKQGAEAHTRPCLALWARLRRGETVRYAVVMLPQLRRKGINMDGQDRQDRKK